MSNHYAIADSISAIVIDKYIKEWLVMESHQIKGYECHPCLNHLDAIPNNVRVQFQINPLTLTHKEGTLCPSI